MQMSRANFVLLILTSLIGLGCTPKVSESEAREMVEAWWGRGGTEIQVVSLHKTDGLAEVEDGANYYTMEYELEVVYPKGHNSGITTYKAGEVYKEMGRIRCIRTEKGWKIIDLQQWPLEK